MVVTVRSIGKALLHYPVLHTCGHYEARLCKYDAPEGFLRAGNACTVCAPHEARGAQESFPTIEAVRKYCDGRNAEYGEVREQNSYEAHQEARRERLTAAATRLRDESQAAFGGAHSMASIIPFGQPILVGHYSERRDRRYRERIGKKMDRGLALSREAEEMQSRADAVGSGGISSDDPDAIVKLQAQVVKLEEVSARMKGANRFIRKGDRVGVASLGFSEKQVAELFTPGRVGGLGFPSFALTNNSANIRRIKQRIASLERNAQRAAIEPIIGDGWQIREDVEDNRVLVEFDAKPSREMLLALRKNGFKWSPTRVAHVRMRSSSALYRAKEILGVKR